MTTYLDSSVILDRILDQPRSSALWQTIGQTTTSVLSEVECLRAIDRFRVLGQLDEAGLVRTRGKLFELFAACERLEIGAPILDRASLPFPLVIKALDAIHLASAMLYREIRGPIRIATTERALARASRAMGFEVLGPL